MTISAEKRGLRPIQEEEGVAREPMRALVDRARGGDVGAFQEIFENFSERTYRYVHARLWNPEDARDAHQDVFLAAWKGLAEFRYEHEGSFPGWLFGIALHVVADHRRRGIRGEAVPLEDAPEPTVEFEGAVVSHRLLVEALGRLPETQREVIVLRFIVGLPARDVAAAVGKSETAVSALQVRALARLRRVVEAEA